MSKKIRKTGAISLYENTFLDPKELNEIIFSRFDFKNNCYEITGGDKTVSTAFIKDKFLRVKGGKIAFPFLFGLATDKEFRKCGYARKILAKIIKDLKGKNRAFLGLYPYPVDKSFYEKFSFSTFSFVSKIALKNLVILGTKIKENPPIKHLKNLYDRVYEKYYSYQKYSLKDFAFNAKKISAFSGKTFGFYYNNYLYGYVCLDQNYVEESYFDYDFIFSKKEQILANFSGEIVHKFIAENANFFALDSADYIDLLVSTPINEKLENYAVSSTLIRPINYIKFLKIFRANFDNSTNYSLKFLISDDILGDVKAQIVCKNKRVRFYNDFLGNDHITLSPKEFTEYVLFSKTSYPLPKTKKSIFDYAFLDKY